MASRNAPKIRTKKSMVDPKKRNRNVSHITEADMSYPPLLLTEFWKIDHFLSLNYLSPRLIIKYTCTVPKSREV